MKIHELLAPFKQLVAPMKKLEQSFDHIASCSKTMNEVMTILDQNLQRDK